MKGKLREWKLTIGDTTYRRVLTTNLVVYWLIGKSIIKNYTKFNNLETRWAEENDCEPEKKHMGGIYG